MDAVGRVEDSRRRIGVRLSLALACMAYLAAMPARAQQPASPPPPDESAWPAVNAPPAPQDAWLLTAAHPPQEATQLAQAAPAPQAPPTVKEEDEEAAAPVDAALSSTEQGQTPLDESFGPRSHAEWVRETRRQAWADTELKVQLRTYYLDREKYDGTESEAWAIGGSLGFKTGYFRDILSLGATIYTSQELHGPEDKDGTLLLAPGQEGYTTLGELYGEFKFNDQIRATVGARGIDTPFINRNDSRMTPNTFLLAVVQGQHGNGTDQSQWRWGAGYIDRIKERNSDEFISMSQDAGAPDGVDRGVFAAGVNYKLGELSLGAINYYSDDIINIFYTEAKYGFELTENMKLRFALQYTDQQSVGDELLTGTDFSAHQWGLKSELAWASTLFTVGYTSADGDADMRGPWSGYPGYTSVQVEDFNRDGEDAWLVRVGYTPKWMDGLSMYALYVQGSDPDSPTAFERDETDFNIQWAPTEGTLKGLMVRLRYARVNQDNPADESDLTDLRVMVYYDLFH